ncbi:hypothetical protein D3C73_1657720 [compost metagenome]
MQEDQIKIGAVAQLPTAQLAVTDNGETAALAIAKVRWLPVAGDHLRPRLLNHGIYNGFGQPG